MSQPLETAPPPERHEELFLARYARLRARALRLAGNDRERAEDLVQDAFVHFTLARPDLAAVGDLDAYLYAVLRNLNVSHLRRLRRLQGRALPAADYDSAEVSLRAADPRDAIRVQDELRACCRYACARKETSKAGSVLILRFLHGYYPREVAAVVGSSREAVEERLRVARSEARQYLKDPSSLRFMRGAKGARGAEARAHAAAALSADELLRELRETVFRSRAGECLSAALLERLYGRGEAPDTATLAHAVSCPRCLDEINRRLGLAPLAERYPTDTLEKEARPKDGDDDEGAGGDMTGTGSGAEEFYRRARRRARDAFEHRPLELCVAVNGRLLASQKVGAPLNEQSLSLRAGEGVDFIEVFSEQEVRLLLLDLSARRGGDRRCAARVGLSDDRTLEASVSFEADAPVVQIVYRDPLSAALPAARAGASEPADESLAGGAGRARDFLRAPARLWGAFAGRGFWLRPGALTAGLAVVIVAALVLVRLDVPAASAAELVRRSVERERSAAADPSLVLHRILYLEERDARGGGAPSRRRVEVWQSAARGLGVRRLYDEKNELIAGAWTTAEGNATVYRRGEARREYGPRGHGAARALAAGDAWLIDLSAADFSALVEDLGRVSVEEAAGSYVLDYRDEARASGLVRAELTLNRADLRAVNQTLVFRGEGGAREYRFTEGAYQRLPAEKVAPEFFRPDAVLDPDGARASGPGGVSGETVARAAVDERRGAAGGAAAAPAELEVEVTYLLNQIRADLGEQLNMTRTPAGALRVEALVESAARKQELLRALRPVSGNPAVLIDVRTVEEALRGRAGGAGRGVTREVEVAAGRIPADEDLRRHFAARLVGEERISEAIRRLSARALGRSRQALLHASALRRLAGRFSAAEVDALAPEARRKWLAMIAGHARAYRREAEALRLELAPVFAPGGAGGGGAAEGFGEAALAQAAERLLQLARSQDEAVRAAFTLSAEGGTAAPVKSAQFWRSLRAAEALAAAIERQGRD
ncbi:MAG TPA: sigma-70 family RNA polymerase sigma factor [Pyrinomonadaceae bacterium]|nr:sigma-70 family RNA polymerase sigma factor [Pyrinomonadaceae bacterium]